MSALQLQWIISDLGGAFFAFAFPPMLLIALVRRAPRGPAWRGTIFLTVAVSWCVNAAYRFGIEVPVAMNLHAARGDAEFDGVGGNVVTLFFTGWALPCIECLAACLIMKNRRKTPPLPAA